MVNERFKEGDKVFYIYIGDFVEVEVKKYLPNSWKYSIVALTETKYVSPDQRWRVREHELYSSKKEYFERRMANVLNSISSLTGEKLELAHVLAHKNFDIPPDSIRREG